MQKKIKKQENQMLGASQTLAPGTHTARSTDQNAKKETAIVSVIEIY
jgi:hypothetical protein